MNNNGDNTIAATHRPANTKPLSWGDGVRFTKKVFDSMSPFSDVREESIQDIQNEFHQNNQKFLQSAQASGKPPVSPMLEPYGRPSLRSDRPPLSSPFGVAAGRGMLKPIGDDSWSDSAKSKSQSHQRSASYGTVSSNLTGSSTSYTRSDESSQQSFEERLWKKMLEKERKKLARESTNSTENSVGSQTESRATGYSADDNWSLATTQTNLSGDALLANVDKKLAREKLEQTKIERKFIRKYIIEMEEERQALMNQWHEDFVNQQDRQYELLHPVRKMGQELTSCIWELIWRFLVTAEVFVSNMPLTIGAVGLSWVTQGVIWFKFMEENIDSCTTVRFNSPQCTFPEFPGCFECDQSNPIYRGVVTFHYICHSVGFLCCLLFIGKCILAWRVVADELSNPATSTPCGVVCITIICVAAGRGLIGEIVVLVTSIFHILLSFWFLYIALVKFRLWPDPGWFPNTVGIAYAAVKTWLYFPVAGLMIMSLCMFYLIFTFPIAIYRAYFNQKLAAPLCFISLSAPSITLYAMTIMAQSTPEGEVELDTDPSFASHWQALHREYYIPVQHFMMILSLIGFASSLHCLWTRWETFKTKPFSPAHMAIIFPLLSHTNAVQAYRAGFDSFSSDPAGSLFHVALFTYWSFCLIVGTGMNLVFSYLYVTKLPEWTQVWNHDKDDNDDQDNDTLSLDLSEIPPPPHQTIVYGMLHDGNGGAHEILHQPFTSPAVLQANEAGTLMRVRRGTHDFEQFGPFVRTRKVSSLGFDLTLSEDELRRERAELLDWVAKNAPRTRNRTMSIPQTFQFLGAGQEGYGSIESHRSQERRGGNPNGQGQGHRPSLTWAV
eukprot:Nitzschia sp. Nitz4//scaffold321_size20361//17423//20242//NITZ4_008689-RA/size20361-augustus-gene-0.1-mRNA-1//-1//CDS//3329547793//6997//frame0